MFFPLRKTPFPSFLSVLDLINDAIPRLLTFFTEVLSSKEEQRIKHSKITQKSLWMLTAHGDTNSNFLN